MKQPMEKLKTGMIFGNLKGLLMQKITKIIKINELEIIYFGFFVGIGFELGEGAISLITKIFHWMAF